VSPERGHWSGLPRPPGGAAEGDVATGADVTLQRTADRAFVVRVGKDGEQTIEHGVIPGEVWIGWKDIAYFVLHKMTEPRTE